MRVKAGGRKVVSRLGCPHRVESGYWHGTAQITTLRGHVHSENSVVSGRHSNFGEAVRLLQARQAQFHFDSEFSKCVLQVALAFAQRQVGDSGAAIATAEQARNTLEPLYKNQLDNANIAQWLSLSYAVIRNKDSALNAAELAIILLPVAKDPVDGPCYEESLAVIQTMLGENKRAISTLARLLQTPYNLFLYLGTPVTPALLRLDPLWDPLRSDPAFQKLCAEKQP